jgi:hypothetical protein
MFRFWFREFVGWMLVLLGLAIFYICIAILLPPEEKIFTAPTLAFIGFIVFRGGIHLLKVATAARIALQAATEPAKPVVTDKKAAKTDLPWDW